MDRNKELLGNMRLLKLCMWSDFVTQGCSGNEVNGGDFDFLQTSYWDPERPHVLHWTTADLAKAEPSKWTRTCQFFLDKDLFAATAWLERLNQWHVIGLNWAIN